MTERSIVGDPSAARRMLTALVMTATQSETQVSREDLNEQMHLVRSTVAGFVRKLPRSVQREDLLAAGTVGLFRALRSSAHLRATCPEMFYTYAKIRIRGAILDELRRHDWSPRRRRTASTAPGSEMKSAPVRVVGFDDLAPDALGSMLSEAGNDDSTSTWGTRSPEEQLGEQASFAELRRCIDELPERERAIIRMRYFDGVQSREIASMLGLSEARVSQLHSRATAMLRSRMVDTAEVAVAA